METVGMSDVIAIKRFFEADGGRKVEMSEMKALTVEDRAELGPLARVELATM